MLGVRRTYRPERRWPGSSAIAALAAFREHRIPRIVLGAQGRAAEDLGDAIDPMEAVAAPTVYWPTLCILG